MFFFKQKTPYEKELSALLKKERRFLKMRENKKESFINRKLSAVVPKKLQGTLDKAFAKAFGLVFEKGTKVIEKTYNKEGLEIDFYENDYRNGVLESKKTLRAFSKKAKNAGNRNLLFSGAAGIGMGIFGIGIPDIPVFTGLLLKSVYEIALDYGFDYDSEKERAFILWVIEGAVSYGENIDKIKDATHPIFKMRLETLGVQQIKQVEDDSSAEYRKEVQSALNFADAKLYEDKATYERDRKELYLEPLQRIAEWEEKGKPIIAENYADGTMQEIAATYGVDAAVVAQ